VSNIPLRGAAVGRQEAQGDEVPNWLTLTARVEQGRTSH